MESLSNVKITRNVSVKTYPFIDYFKGFEKVEAVRKIFGDKTEEVLHNLKIEFNSGRGYMGISDVDGHIRVGGDYLNNGSTVDIYLDVIHELVHVKQFMEGKKLYRENLIFVEESMEIEACHHVVDEARNLGMSDEQIIEHLRTDRMTDDDINRLAKALKLKVKKPPKTYRLA